MPTLKLLPFHTTRIATPVIELIFFGERHKFIVDTGASSSVISYRLFNKFPLTEKHFSQIETGKLMGSAGKREAMRVPFTINFLGKLTNYVSVGYFLDEWHKEQGVTFSGLLGQDVMRQFKKVLIDYEVGTISFVDK